MSQAPSGFSNFRGWLNCRMWPTPTKPHEVSSPAQTAVSAASIATVAQASIRTNPLSSSRPAKAPSPMLMQAMQNSRVVNAKSLLSPPKGKPTPESKPTFGFELDELADFFNARQICPIIAQSVIDKFNACFPIPTNQESTKFKQNAKTCICTSLREIENGLDAGMEILKKNLKNPLPKEEQVRVRNFLFYIEATNYALEISLTYRQYQQSHHLQPNSGFNQEYRRSSHFQFSFVLQNTFNFYDEVIEQLKYFISYQIQIPNEDSSYILRCYKDFKQELETKKAQINAKI